MKNKFVILVWAGIAFSNTLKAQCKEVVMEDIYTPNGNPVETLIMCEDGWDIRFERDTALMAKFPEAIQIETYDGLSSTNRFNCHGYAWLITKGGPERWLGGYSSFKDPETYINDSSYIEAPPGTHPAIVYWEYPGYHSAITTAHPDTFISKWGNGPLIKHYKDCYRIEYQLGFGGYKYYVKAPITGPNTICYNGGGQFNLTDPPQGTVYWTVTGPFSFSSSNPDLKETTTTNTHKPTVYWTTEVRTTGTLNAFDAPTSGTPIAKKTITPCETSIYGLTNLVVGGTYSFGVINPPPNYSWDKSSHLSEVYPGRYTATTAGNGWVRILSGSTQVAIHNVSIPAIIGLNTDVCYFGSTFSLLGVPAGNKVVWSIGAGFSLSDTTDTSATVRKTSANANLSATLMAKNLNGTLITQKTIYGCNDPQPFIYELEHGTDMVCYSGSTFTLFGAPVGSTVKWSLSGAGFSLSDTTGSTTTVTKTLSGFNLSATLTATVNGIAFTKTIYGCDMDAVYTLYQAPAGITVVWEISDPINFTLSDTTGITTTVTITGTGADSAVLKAKNKSNRKVLAQKTIHVCNPSKRSNVAGDSKSESSYGTNEFHLGAYVSVYPNPTNGILTIEIDEDAIVQQSGRNPSVYDIRLYDMQGNLLRQASIHGGTVQFNVANLLIGIYYLHVYDGISEKPVMRQVVVER